MEKLWLANTDTLITLVLFSCRCILLLLLSLSSKKRAAYLWFPHLPLTFIYLLWGIVAAAADSISSCRHIWQPMKCKDPDWLHFRN